MNDLVAHLGSKAVFERLRRYAIRKRVPERHAEDVVQDSLREAWMQQHAWGATKEDLDRLLYRITKCNILDHKKAWKRRKTVFLEDLRVAGDDFDADWIETGDAGAPSASGAGASDAAESAGERKSYEDKDVPPVAVPTLTEALSTRPAPLEQREQLRLVQQYVEDNPGLARAAGWLMRHYFGESMREIAESEGVTENAVATAISKFRARVHDALAEGFKALLLMFLVAALWQAVLRRHRPEDETAVPGPKPAPTIVAPSPPAPAPKPQPSAEELRRRGLEECAAKQWGECLEDLDAAERLDPAGESDARVRAARKALARVLSEEKPPK